MANEAVLKIETHLPINFTCSTTATIEKGAICQMTSPMTAVLGETIDGVVAGIAQSEKLAADTTQTSIAIFRGGVFKVLVSGSASAGDPVSMSGTANTVYKSSVNVENVVGYMMEDATNGQTKLMELRPTTMSLA